MTQLFIFDWSTGIESVEQFFRAFGAKQVPYFQIAKDDRPFVIKGSLHFFLLAGA